MIDTKQKILDTAERLFGDQGYSATSLRQVIAAAEVNIAAVHYHFGSKEDLLDAIVERKAGPVTKARMERLAQVENDARGGAPDLEGVLESFLLPTGEMAQTNPTFVKLMGRMLSEGLMPRIIQKHFHDSAMQFIGALMRAAPHLNQEEMMWRIHFMTGAMAHTMAGEPILPLALGPVDYPLRMKRLARFLAAGFRAPGEAKEK